MYRTEGKIIIIINFGPPGGHVFRLYVCICRTITSSIVYSNKIDRKTNNNRRISNVSSSILPCFCAYRPFCSLYVLFLLVKPRLVRLTVHSVHKRECSLLHRQNIKVTPTEKELLRVKRKIRTKTIFNYMTYVRTQHTLTHIHTHVNGSNSHRDRPFDRQCVVDAIT